MDGLQGLLGKLNMEDVEKLRALMSFVPEAAAKEVVTLRVFAEEYETIVQNIRSISYFKSVSTAFKYLFEFFGPQKAIGSISLKDVESFMIFLQKKVAKGYVVYYRNLKAAFNKALDWGYVKENYFTKVKLPKRQKTAPVFIDSDQLAAISNQIKLKVVRDVVAIGFYTGMRLNEIVNLRWKNVDLNTRTITVGDEEFVTKGRKQRFIPICDEAFEVLSRSQKTCFDKLSNRISSQNESRKITIHKINESGINPPLYPLPRGDNKNGYVFCKKNKERFSGDYFSRRFKRACKAAGMDKAIHFHSLRHSFASNLAQQGVSLYVIKELLGHSSISTTEIYSHLNMESLRDAIRVLDDLKPHSATADRSKSLSLVSTGSVTTGRGTFRPHPKSLSLERRGTFKAGGKNGL